MTVGTVLVILAAHSIGGVPGTPTGKLARFEFESKHMGTTFRIVLYTTASVQAEKAAKAGFDEVARLDRIMSDYDPKSELMRLCRENDADPGRPVVVSADLFAVLQQAQAISRQSGGAFDVTAGPLVRLWRLARRTQRLPEEKELAEALTRVGYQKLTLDETRRTVALKVPGMRLDLGGIAKGYAADQVLRLLREKFGIRRALVAASGDIACSEPPPDRDGWIVAIAPLSKGQPARSLLLRQCAVSTSGDLEQFVEINGVRYSHVLDPRTGIGLTGRRSVTVVAPRGALADGLTKAVSVLPIDRALELIESSEGTAGFVAVKETDTGPVKVTESRRFRSYLARQLQEIDRGSGMN